MGFVVLPPGKFGLPVEVTVDADAFVTKYSGWVQAVSVTSVSLTVWLTTVAEARIYSCPVMACPASVPHTHTISMDLCFDTRENHLMLSEEHAVIR